MPGYPFPCTKCETPDNHTKLFALGYKIQSLYHARNSIKSCSGKVYVESERKTDSTEGPNPAVLENLPFENHCKKISRIF